MTTTSHLSISLIEQNQAQKEVTANEAFVALDALLNTGVIDKDFATPPSSPSNGDVYIVAASATGDWASKDGQVAWYQDSWNFIAPSEGLTLWVNDENKPYVYDGAAWIVAAATQLDDLSDVTIASVAANEVLQYNGSQFVNSANVDNLGRVGVNAAADSTNKLSVASDAVLFDTDTGNCQIKVNKNASTDTASYLFQTGYSGRAEFGTVGGDNFQLKVSPDGSTFYQALVVDKDTGNVDFKQQVSLADTLNCVDQLVTRPEIKDYAETRSSASSGTAYTIDLENGNVHEITLTGNCTFTFSNPPASGKAGSFTLILAQDATGSRTTTWPGSVIWPGGNAPSLSSGASEVDVLTFLTTDGGSIWFGAVCGLNFS